MSTTSKSRNKLFFSGVLLLTFSNLLIKVIGLVLKMMLHPYLGDVGMSYYSVAYDIYVWLYMISTAGLPVAISIMISESRAKGNLREAKKIFRVTLLVFVIIGLVGMSVMLFGSRWFASMYEIDNSCYCIMAIAPTLFFICISSAIRGYFQGFQNMFPTSISQIIEALGKLVIGILMASYAIKQGYELYIVAAYTISGLTIGVAAGMLFLVISKWTFRATSYDAEYLTPESNRMPVRSCGQLLRVLLFTAIPITFSSSIMSFTNVLDGIIIGQRLTSIGYTAEMYEAAIGNYKALAIPMYNLPPALIYPISYSIVPLLSASIASGAKDRVKLVMQSSLRVTALLMLPCGLGLSALSYPILRLLFNEASALKAAPLLSVLAPSVLPVGMLAITNAILQAHKLERKPLISILIGSIVKLISSYILLGIPGIEMYGAPIGTFLCYLTIVAINFYFMAKYIGWIPHFGKILFRPLIASVLCAGAAVGSYLLISNVWTSRFAVLPAIAVAVAVYVIAIFLFRAIGEDDVRLLPKGDRIYQLLHRLKLM